MGSPGRKLYLQKSVLDALRERLEWIFDNYADIIVSISGGKDSTVLFDAARREAERRGRSINVFFLDQEAEYQATIDQIRYSMSLPCVKPWWFQIPMRLTNATSYEDEFLYAWEPGAEWMREKEPMSIHDVPGAPDRFYKFLSWFEAQRGPSACFLVGLRSEESLNRYGAVTRNPAIKGKNWSSKGKGGTVLFYPLYDWTFEDIWTYIGKIGVRYNRAYDRMYVKGKNIHEMRVSNLIHEKAFKCLSNLQEFEPDTYDRLVRRTKGTATAARYAEEAVVFRAGQLPERFISWKIYRDFLLETIPTRRKTTFEKRFSMQEQNETVYRQQVKQLLINDWENNVPVTVRKPPEDALKKWMEIL